MNDVVWHKSSYSNQAGGDCVEVATELLAVVPVRDASGTSWRKSSYSNQEGGNCVEVADGVTGVVPVRDSKAPGGPVLCFEHGSWARFIGELKVGRSRH
ncbi:DUF397 domain-containing protein [Streptomyces mayonensis]|uniref:DUF397 domain-containing protein n=1 Tax=Streptomyces mayonensis TaxID=2750816 RepID=UPI001C1E5298|nr:DUF397 domain-containing protein [Streptomyces sp. A108]MBU6530922.1 DUF397 domain-containing protein [Streptomyces sp. A108]